MEIIHKDFVIVGAGIAGLATAIGLWRIDLPYLVIERAAELRATGSALALWPNAWRTLEALGVAHKLTPHYPPLKKVTVTSLSSGETQVVIGCDGVHSAVARWLGFDEPVNSGRSALRSTAVFPDGHGFDHEFHQLLGEGTRTGFIPLNDKELYWFTTYRSRPEDGDIMRHPTLILEDVLQRLGKNLPAKYVEAMRKTDLETLSLAPLMFRWPWALFFGHVSKGNVTVAGDAMHPMTPELGQGGCAALEDAVVLVRNMAEALQKDGEVKVDEKKVEEALKKYVKERRFRTAGLITGALLSGWVQAEPGWLVRMIRDNVFYRHVFHKILNFSDYDCGKLPVTSSRH